MSEASFDPQAAAEARDEGMARAEAGASPDWSYLLQAAVRAVATLKRTFTADDVFEYAERVGVPATHENHAFGPVMIRAVKAGYCKKANTAPVLSRRVSRHRCPLTVWESLLR